MVVDGEGDADITGDLTLRGVTREVTLDAGMVGHGADPGCSFPSWVPVHFWVRGVIQSGDLPCDGSWDSCAGSHGLQRWRWRQNCPAKMTSQISKPAQR